MAFDTALTLLGVVGLVCLVVVAWAGRKRFPLRIGVGNFFRRKTQVAIVVAGLLIGTSIITSSYVIQTTFDYTIRSAVYRALDHTDETITVVAPDGSRSFFPEGVFDGLLANRSAMPRIDALAPRIHLGGAVVDSTTRLFEPSATVIGFNATYEPGTFVREDGSSWTGSDLGIADVILNEHLAKNLEAKTGDDVVLVMGGPSGFVQLPVKVRAIVQVAGLGAYGDGPDAFVRLATLQSALAVPGKINLVSVSNVGGVTEGYLRSDDAVRELTTHLPVAAVILWAFAQIFPPDAFGGVGFVLSWTWSDVIQGFSIGFLITMGTIAIASWRVSKLNIVRAIRDIPEPVQHRSTRRQIALGAGLSLLGLSLTAAALLRQSLILQDLGPVTLALGLAILTMRVVPARAVFTLAGAFIVGWVLSPWKFFSTATADITLFILAGLFLILGSLLMVLFNSDALLAVATRLVRGRTWRPVVRTAIAYPMNKKFRTAATLPSIALIMFTIATRSGIQTMVSGSIESAVH